MDKNNLIAGLDLQPHPEGGYFRRTYAASGLCSAAHGPQRPTMSSIYYLLTEDSPIGHWHRNRSDILHYFHCGSPLQYWLLSPAGELSGHTLGCHLEAGETPQLLVPGGYWKATELLAGECGLLSEAVTPGFETEDMEMAEAERLAADFPQHASLIHRLALPTAPLPRGGGR